MHGFHGYKSVNPLFEMLIVVAIILILAAIAIPQFAKQEIQCKSNSGNIVFEGKVRGLHETSPGVWRFTTKPDGGNGENVQVIGFCTPHKKSDSGYRSLN